jgi:hypothetical protein
MVLRLQALLEKADVRRHPQDAAGINPPHKGEGSR